MVMVAVLLLEVADVPSTIYSNTEYSTDVTTT